MKNNYKFLNNINFPSDLRKVSENDLQQVADEVREEMISAVSKTGGHLGACLLYTSDAADDLLCVDLGGRRIIKKKSIKEIKFFESVGSDIGLLFQIADDLIDFKGNSKIAGKKTKKDQKKGKATLISLLGYDASIKYCGKIISDINRNLKIYGSKSKKLNDTLEFILNRNK